VKKLENLPLTSNDARQILAGVAVTDSRHAKPLTPAVFLEDFKKGLLGNRKLRIGEMITSRQRLLGLDATLDASLGATCVRYTRLTEITGQFPAFPDLVAITSTRGLACSHLYSPQFDVDVTYQQVYAKGQNALPLDAEADAFLKSLAFTRSQPVAGTTPGALWTSQMETGVQAYERQRWPEAEASFRAGLKASEYFGPHNLAMAMTLYYLASTETNLGRSADAEPHFRQALDIFETPSDVDDPELAQIGGKVAEFHGMVLQDLAVLYATQAGRSASSSVKQSQLNEAEHLLQRALAIRQASDPSQVGRTLSNLTQVYIDLGRWSEAAVSAQGAASFYEQQGGPDSQQAIYELDRLADIYLQQGRLADAEPLIPLSCQACRRPLGRTTQRSPCDSSPTRSPSGRQVAKLRPVKSRPRPRRFEAVLRRFDDAPAGPVHICGRSMSVSAQSERTTWRVFERHLAGGPEAFARMPVRSGIGAGRTEVRPYDPSGAWCSVLGAVPSAWCGSGSCADAPGPTASDATRGSVKTRRRQRGVPRPAHTCGRAR
jgi:tetratricopeptide (TPR) repeat protein